MPQLPRLVYLLKKYCHGTPKTVEDLQKDLFGVNDDFRQLELLLKGEKVTTWSAIEDHMLRKYAGDIKSTEFQLLISQKGHEDVTKRRDFLGV